MRDLALLQGLAGLDIVGCDVNTVAPLFDPHGQTAWLAATVVMEFCYLLAAVPRHAAAATGGPNA